MRRSLLSVALCGALGVSGPYAAAQQRVESISESLPRATARTSQFFTGGEPDPAVSADPKAYRRDALRNYGELFESPDAQNSPESRLQPAGYHGFSESFGSGRSDLSIQQIRATETEYSLSPRRDSRPASPEGPSESFGQPQRTEANPFEAFGRSSGQHESTTSSALTPREETSAATTPAGHSLLTKPISTVPTSPAVSEGAESRRVTITAPRSTTPYTSGAPAAEHQGEAEASIAPAGLTGGDYEAAIGAQTTTVTAHWTTNGGLNVGQESQCQLLVKNTGKAIARDVVVESHFPPSVRLVSASPAPASTQPHVIWNFVRLAPGEEKTIQVKLIPSRQGAFQPIAHVRTTTLATGKFVVEQPMIQVAMSGPREVFVGEPVSHSVVVSNPGSGIAKNVNVEAVIPDGLEHARGKRLLMELGSLAPGETRKVRLAMVAVAGGEKSVQVHVTGQGDLQESATAMVNVVAPSLEAHIDGPSLRYLGRAADYTIRVQNDGDAATDNIQVMHKVPEGFKYVSSTRGAKYESHTRIVSWFLGRLEAEQAVEFTVTLEPTQTGDFTHFLRVTSDVGVQSDAHVSTRVEGAASLVLKIADLDDPVEVGRETAYDIEIRNEGSAAAQNVGLTCELPEGMQLVRASGPSDHRADGTTVSFQPLPNISAGQAVSYRVFVRGSRGGQVRFRTRLTSDSSSESLTTEELTRFYGE